MPKKYVKYLFAILVLTSSLRAKAQEDSTFSNLIASNISTESLQNTDLVSIKQILSNQRIKLQSTFDKNENKRNIEEVHQQTALLEELIIHYLNMNHKVIVNEMDIQRTNEDSELLLARLVYIKSKTWCMEESLQGRVNELYLKSKNNELVDQKMIDVLYLTETVISKLEKARSFDRMKYRYNHEIVISNWKTTTEIIKKIEPNQEGIDAEFKAKYSNILKELNVMTGVLAMFQT